MRNIKKIHKKAKIQSIQRQDSEGFQEIVFERGEKDYQVIMDLLGITLPEKVIAPPKPKVKAKPKPPPRRPTPPEREEKKQHAKGIPLKDHGKPVIDEVPKHPYHAIRSSLKAMWIDRNLHADLCPDKDDYYHYEEHVLSMINRIIPLLDTLNKDKKLDLA